MSTILRKITPLARIFIEICCKYIFGINANCYAALNTLILFFINVFYYRNYENYVGADPRDRVGETQRDECGG